eukprot:771828-Amphidinium_carterae.1
MILIEGLPLHPLESTAARVVGKAPAGANPNAAWSSVMSQGTWRCFQRASNRSSASWIRMAVSGSSSKVRPMPLPTTIAYYPHIL